MDYCNDGGADRPLALHWDGSAWTSSPVPGAGLLREVKAIGPSNVWAAGAYYNTSLQGHQTLVVQFDGTNWTTAVSADSHSASDEVIGLAANPDGSALTLVGRAGPSALIEQASCSSGPVSLPTRSPAALPPLPPAPGVGPVPNPPKPTPPAQTPIPVTIADQAAAAGIDGKQDWSFSATVADLTRDGWPDLFVSHH